VREVKLQHLDLAEPTHAAIAAAEAASNLARYDGVRFGHAAPAPGVRALYERTRGEGFGVEVTRHVLLGTHLLSDPGPGGMLRRAQGARGRIAHDLADVFGQVELLVAPSPPGSAANGMEPGPRELDHPLTLAANLAGLPAMTVPVGLAQGVPTSVQLLARHFGEALMIRAAAALERLRLAESTA
jgi:aspartyl-tRNA(Asn)/glutamyl-tRNA(Gln) amidotransferase subunit A